MSGNVVRKKRFGYSENNTAHLLRSGNNFFSTLEKLIDAAVFEIHFQTYIFEEDETGNRIKNALMRAAGRGVRIYLLLDAYGSNHLSEKFLNEMRKSKIEVRLFGRLFKKGKFHIGRRLHRKVVVIDGSTSIVSGINISNNYNELPQSPAWLDFGVLITGEIPRRLQLICKKSWMKIRFPKLSKKINLSSFEEIRTIAPTLKVRIRQNDWKIGKNQAAKSYRQFIRQARESITIVGGYFLPGRKGRNLLKQASERGVIIKLVIAEHSDVGLMHNAMLYLYDYLIRHGIRIFEYQPSNVHGKAIVSDKRMISIGSYDLNTLSTYSNIELNLDIDDQSFAGGFHEELEQIILKDCREISVDILKKRGLKKRFIQWLSYRIVKSLFVLSIWLARNDLEETYQ